jgi:hypothetical protein
VLSRLKGPFTKYWQKVKRCDKIKNKCFSFWHSFMFLLLVTTTCHGSELLTFYGGTLCKPPDSSVGRAAVRYSEGWEFASQSVFTYFSHPVTFGAQLGIVTGYNSEFKLHCSVTLWNSRMNFNIAGDCHGSEVFTY